MDLISHGLWGGLVLGRKGNYWLAALLGMLPDLIAFAPYWATRILWGGQGFVPPAVYPDWVVTLYNSTHSLIIAGVVFCFLCWLREDIALIFLAWPLHIVFDIPTHSADCFPTRFLFPLSNLYFDGMHWRNFPVTLVNWAAIALFYWLQRSRKLASPDYKKT